MPRTFYRIIPGDRPMPTQEDFLSYAALGKRPFREDAETLRLLEGISVFDTAEAAKRKALGQPWLGNAYLAELVIPDTGLVRYERTGKGTGHYTLWGTPDVLLGCVARRVPL